MSAFVHMSGAGNTFLVGKTDKQYSPEEITKIIAAQPRADGQSIEGLLTLRSIAPSSFVSDFYNPDGSRGMMCGNGARCIVRFASDNGIDKNDSSISFSLNDVQYSASIVNEHVTVTLPAPLSERQYERGSLDNVKDSAYYVDVNSDHVVIGGPLDAARDIVQTLRHHPEFAHGVNVNMCDGLGSGSIRMATFERGVEAITGACGTGAVSAAIAGWRAYGGPTTVTIEPPSKRRLIVTIHHTNDTITSIDLTGDAQYDGDPE